MKTNRKKTLWQTAACVIVLLILLAAYFSSGCQTAIPSFEITAKQYVENNLENEIEIIYPQINGMRNETKAERINSMIEKDIKKYIVERGVIPGLERADVFFKYEIKFVNDKFISVFYTGFYGITSPGRASRIYAAATTIDLEREEVITLNDLITDFDSLYNLLDTDKFEAISIWDGKKSDCVFSELGIDRDDLATSSGDTLDSATDWYTDGDNLVLVIITRDYEEFAIKIEEIQDILNFKFD